MKKMKALIAVICSVLALGVATASGCSAKNLTNVVPYIPPAYFSGQLVLPFDLAAIYYSPYTPKTEVAKLAGTVYIFKNLKVTEITMASTDKDYVWMDIVKAYALNPANIKQLKLGETVDVAGVLSGPCKDFPNSLTFTGCVFIPSGIVSLPVAGDSPLQYTPTY
jgi:hypothetical protein